MLDRRDLVVVVAVGPRHDRPLVHLRPMLPVKLGRPLERPALAQLVGAEIRIPLPQLVVPGKLVDHLASLAVPLGMLGLVEDLLGHVARTDHRTGHDARDLLSGTGKAEDISGKHTDALPRLLDGVRRLGGLRIVDHDELRADRPPVRLLVLHATDSARDARHPDDHAGRRRARNG